MKKLIVITALLCLVVPMSADAKPMTLVKAKWLQATTTPTAISVLMGSASGNECAVKIKNPSTTVLCIGGSDVDTTVAAGGKCYPVCDGASPCGETSVPIVSPASSVYVVVSSGTLDFVVITGGNC